MNFFLEKVFKNNTNFEGNLINLIGKILKFDAEERLSALEILAHVYFDEIRDKDLELKLVGINIANLYNFSPSKINNFNLFYLNLFVFVKIEEISQNSFNKKLIPHWL